MEHAQRAYMINFIILHNIKVLILILMEHAQRGLHNMLSYLYGNSLNPYFNGTCSKSFHRLLTANNLLSKS